MKKLFFISLSVFFCFSSVFSQVYTGKIADTYVKGSEKVWFSKNNNNPAYIKLKSSCQPEFSDLSNWFRKTFNTVDGLNFIIKKTETDKLGFTHYRCIQTYNETEIFGTDFIVHVRDGKINSLNGKVISDIHISNNTSFSENEAINFALSFTNADEYMWQSPEDENRLKEIKGNTGASYYPTPTKIILYDEATKTHRYAYQIDVFAKKPLSRKNVYVDAQNGSILKTLNKLHETDVPGTAVTKYSGTQTITTDSMAPDSYRLHETGRGNGIRTYNMQEQTNYSSAVDFTDSDNYWDNVNAQIDEAATDAHWGAEMTYDYYMQHHSRNSIDGDGFALISYIHYDNEYANAFWDGEKMTYGDGENNNPFTTLDICGHEVSHGLTEFTAGLIYEKESGALNESFSDIFGTSIEFFGKPAQANWTCGEDMGYIIRNLSNPNEKDDPDTYDGDFWVDQNCSPSSQNDYCGVHTNSGVLNFWFYLVSMGGSDTNDIGNAYNVSGIGIDDAAAVAFRLLTVYLNSTSDYADARFYAIVSATELFGGCSPEVETVTNAMYAVGIGAPYTSDVVVEFSANNNESCTAPLQVQFHNFSTNATDFIWYFGDGDTSHQANPYHTYTALGDYDVKLIASSTGCGIDSLTQTAFVSIASTNSNYAVMPASGTVQTLTCCTGSLFDSGGETGEYANNTDGSITISPFGAATVRLYFSSFSFENGYDYLYVYDGPSTASPLIGQYDGSNLPEGGTIISTYGSITLRQTTDQGLVESGFALSWQCDMPTAAPTSNFNTSETSTCSGVVHFQDFSYNGPISWHWDFGDGDTSNLQNPVHAYQSEGLYTVSLTTQNAFGSNTYTRTDYIEVSNLPDAPIAISDTGCLSETVHLSASGQGQLEWYDMPVEGTLLHTGPDFITPVLNTSATYYIEDKLVPASQYVGKLNNSGSGDYFGNPTNIHYLIFNAAVPLTIASVKVYAEYDGNRTILLRDSNATVLQSATIYIPDNESRITLNFDVPAQNKLQLVGDGSPDLFRNNQNAAAYPYTIANMVTITESSASLPPYNVSGNYYYFYDWEVHEKACSSPRVPVKATVVDCTGFEEPAENFSIKVYPNPSEENVFVEFNISSGEDYTLAIYNIIGKTVFNKTGACITGKNLLQINCNDFESGIYLLQFRSKSQSYTQKLIIQ